MKKRTFGRIAAVGLAGLTAIPAVAIVASADVTIDASAKTLSGTAYRLSWTTTQTTTQTLATALLGTDGKYKVTFQDYSQNSYPTGNFNVSVGTAPKYSDSKYIDSTMNVNYIKAQISNAITVAGNIADNNIANWKKQWNDTVSDYNNWVDAVNYVKSAVVANPEAERQFTDSQGSIQTVNSTTMTNPNPYENKINNLMSSQNILVTDKYECKPVTENKTMKQLSDELGTLKVDINSGVITSGTTYTLSLTGGSSTDTGSTGSYGTYEIPAGYRYSDTKSYTVDYVTWYPNLPALRAVWGSAVAVNSKTPNPGYSTSLCWFDPTDGNYYTAAQVNSGYHPWAVLVSYGATTSNTEYAVYRVDNGYYYHTWSSACAAAGNDTSRITFVRNYTSAGNYFSRVTGSFYNYYEDALYASRNNSSLVVLVNGNSAYGSYYDDPYYYYFMNRGNSGSSSSSSLGGSSVKIGNKSGWSNVRSSIRSAKSGASLSVTMNGETSIPEEILTALDGKDVDVNFKLKNGAVVTINGQDISTPKDVNVAVTYNTKNVPSGLVKKATNVNNSLSTSQISVSSNTFGGKIGVTVKYSANRAGCSAKIYRYNSSRNSLQLVDTSTVSSSGKVTFDGMTQGGDFVIVLFEK